MDDNTQQQQQPENWWREALDYSRELYVDGVKWSGQYQPMREKFGYTDKRCDEIYQEMREEITCEIWEAKADPIAFMGQRHKETRNRKSAPWSVRISAQVELDELYELVEVAKEPAGWEDDRLQEAWAFYAAAANSESITEAQRHRVRKRQELLLRGPKRYRHTSEARDRMQRDLQRLRPGRRQPLDAAKGHEPTQDAPLIHLSATGEIEVRNDPTGELTRKMQRAGVLSMEDESEALGERGSAVEVGTAGEPGAAVEVGTAQELVGGAGQDVGDPLAGGAIEKHDTLKRELQQDKRKLAAIKQHVSELKRGGQPSTQPTRDEPDSSGPEELQRMVGAAPDSLSSSPRLSESDKTSDEIPPTAQPPP